MGKAKLFNDLWSVVWEKATKSEIFNGYEFISDPYGKVKDVGVERAVKMHPIEMWKRGGDRPWGEFYKLYILLVVTAGSFAKNEGWFF